MSNKDILLLAAVGVAAVMYMKRAKAAPAQTVSRPTTSNTGTTNINGDMWAKILGSGWKALTSSNADGSSPFTMKNWLGQDVTSNGTPIYSPLLDILPSNTNDGEYYDLYLGGDHDYAGDLFPLTSGWL